jgi:uncharacterized lipoprotein YddW (UPF0748 family)
VKRSVICAMLAACAIGAMAAPAEMRAFYAPTFDINTQANCDVIIADTLAHNINAVFVEVRGRADAYYYPNRDDSTYPNSEPRGQLYTISPSDLDVLQYFIDRLHAASPRVEVHAWLTTYNTWNRTTPPSSSSHIYNAHPEWITQDSSGNYVNYPVPSAGDDAPLDPGIPAVQDHLYSVFMDIVRNYDVDGIQFDYIRLLGADSGYNTTALARFQAETGFTYNPASPGALSEVYEAWRRDQVAQLVQRVHAQTMLEKPWIEVSAFLVNFSDSVENLAQGYNWWVAHGAIDVLHPGCYSTTVSGTESDWDFYVGKLAQSGDESTRPMVAALGSYLVVDSTNYVYDPPRNNQFVTTLRANTRVPEGFNFFAHSALFEVSEGADPPGILADNLFNSGGPMDTWVDVPAIPHKTDEETTPPNAPASLSATLSGGVPQITFNRPAAAGDGDLPVHYRLYRDTDSSVELYYDNLVMEWWDPGSPRASFTFDDTAAGVGTYHYAAVAYDNWNNEALATAGPVTVTSGTTYIIETIAGMINAGDYSEPSGSFSGSSAHSTATGLTYPAPDPASRFATPGTDGSSRLDVARFTPSGLATGTYDVYVTTHHFTSANAQGITVRLNDDGGISTSIFDLTNSTAGDTWTQCATMDFTSGLGHWVEFDNATQTNWGGSTDSRMAACAVRLVAQGSAAPTPWEPKPPVSPPLGSAADVIADSTPQALDYDDWGGAGGWVTDTQAGDYLGSSRLYATANFPFDDYAVWAVDLPRAGHWAIDGWVRSNSNLATGAQYRFVDRLGTVHSVTTTQRSGSSDWNINVDGVIDANAYQFDAGRVYVILHGNTGGTQAVIADALCFRYLSDLPVGLTLLGQQ